MTLIKFRNRDAERVGTDSSALLPVSQPPGLGLRERNLVTQDFLLMAPYQKSKLSTEAGTQGQVRASLWGYGFWGMFRDEGSRGLGVQTLRKKSG